MNPQQGTSHVPFFETVAFKEPLRSSLMLTIAGEVVIGEGIWWRLPFPKAFSCDRVRHSIFRENGLSTNASRLSHERCRQQAVLQL
jgi:hypothetical protein